MEVPCGKSTNTILDPLQILCLLIFTQLYQVPPELMFSGFIFVHAGKVLVHCARGISRSATLALAYLMIKERLTLVEATEAVRRHRNILPNIGFLNQLRQLDRSLVLHRKTTQQPWAGREKHKETLLQQERFESKVHFLHYSWVTLEPLRFLKHIITCCSNTVRNIWDWKNTFHQIYTKKMYLVIWFMYLIHRYMVKLRVISFIQLTGRNSLFNADQPSGTVRPGFTQTISPCLLWNPKTAPHGFPTISCIDYPELQVSMKNRQRSFTEKILKHARKQAGTFTRWVMKIWPQGRCRCCRWGRGQVITGNTGPTKVKQGAACEHRRQQTNASSTARHNANRRKSRRVGHAADYCEPALCTQAGNTVAHDVLRAQREREQVRKPFCRHAFNITLSKTYI